MRIRRTVLLTLVFAYALFPSNHLLSAEESATKSPARELLDQAYEIAQGADKASDFTNALRLCRDAKNATNDPNEIAYVKQLAGWLYNKRGEFYADKAEAEGYLTEAQALEAARKALSDFESAIKLNPNDWMARHNRGVSKASFGQFEEAVKEFTYAVKLNPKHQNAWFNRAEIYYQLSKYAAAEKDYSEAIKLDPQDAIAVTGRGHARYHQEKYNEALEDYNLSIRLQPNEGEAYADRADLYAHTQNWESAARDYRVALSLDKSLARAYKNVAWLMSTCPSEKYRNPEMALKAATKAVELAGEDDYRYLEVLAAAQAGAGKKAEARLTLQKAIKIAPAPVASQMNVQLASYVE